MRDWARFVLWFARPDWVRRWQAGEMEFPTPWIDVAVDDPEIASALGGARVVYRAVSALGLEVCVTPPAYAKNIKAEIGFDRPKP